MNRIIGEISLKMIGAPLALLAGLPIFPAQDICVVVPSQIQLAELDGKPLDGRLVVKIKNGPPKRTELQPRSDFGDQEVGPS